MSTNTSNAAQPSNTYTTIQTPENSVDTDSPLSLVHHLIRFQAPPNSNEASLSTSNVVSLNSSACFSDDTEFTPVMVDSVQATPNEETSPQSEAQVPSSNVQTTTNNENSTNENSTNGIREPLQRAQRIVFSILE